MSTSGIIANWNPCIFGIRRGRRQKEKTRATRIFKRTMASTSDIDYEIIKFDRKNCVLWKEIMKDVLIIRRQIAVIRHNNTLLMMTTEEWQSLDDIP